MKKAWSVIAVSMALLEGSLPLVEAVPVSQGIPAPRLAAIRRKIAALRRAWSDELGALLSAPN